MQTPVPRYVVLCSLTHRSLAWSYDPARALGLLDSLRARARGCYLEARS